MIAAADENSDFAREIGADLGRLNEFGLEDGMKDENLDLDLGLDEAVLDLNEVPEVKD